MESQKYSPLLISRLQNALKSQSSDVSEELFCGEISFTELNLELQNGRPICGFSALMAASSYLIGHKTTINDAINAAKDMGYTNNGELFSAVWMAEIVRKLFDISAQVSSFLAPKEFVNYFRNCETSSQKSRFVLVPYDCDKNFEPCQRKGEAAHWAVITGFFIVDRSRNGGTITPFQNNQASESVPESDLCLIAYHGKSRHPAVWFYNSLKVSNAQLVTPDSKRVTEFRLPNESIAEALCGKCVLLG
ncbi:UPF0692 protein C19orf54 like protein [Ditylenchus destructor]|nr:UPF0692 protein C19orf54 like protein [Ditylenchus destructor]